MNRTCTREETCDTALLAIRHLEDAMGHPPPKDRVYTTNQTTASEVRVNKFVELARDDVQMNILTLDSGERVYN